MKKDEAISILATSQRPREPKDRARYDEAVKMAIEALSCSEIPNNSDTISRQQAIDAVAKWIFEVFGIKESDGTATVFKRLRELPPVQPEREVARMVIGKSKGGVTLWSECNKCREPVDPDDNFCRNCGRRFVIDE